MEKYLLLRRIFISEMSDLIEVFSKDFVDRAFKGNVAKDILDSVKKFKRKLRHGEPEWELHVNIAREQRDFLSAVFIAVKEHRPDDFQIVTENPALTRIMQDAILLIREYVDT